MGTTDAETPADISPADRHAETPPLSVTLLGTGTSTGVPVLGAVPAWAVGLGFVLAVAASAVYNVHSQEGGWPFSRLL